MNVVQDFLTASIGRAILNVNVVWLCYLMANVPGLQYNLLPAGWRKTCNHQLLAVPCYRLNTYGRRAFSVAGPTVWNSLPDLNQDCRLFQTFA